MCTKKKEKNLILKQVKSTQKVNKEKTQKRVIHRQLQLYLMEV